MVSMIDVRKQITWFCILALCIASCAETQVPTATPVVPKIDVANPVISLPYKKASSSKKEIGLQIVSKTVTHVYPIQNSMIVETLDPEGSRLGVIVDGRLQFPTHLNVNSWAISDVSKKTIPEKSSCVYVATLAGDYPNNLWMNLHTPEMSGCSSGAREGWARLGKDAWEPKRTEFAYELLQYDIPENLKGSFSGKNTIAFHMNKGDVRYFHTPLTDPNSVTKHPSGVLKTAASCIHFFGKDEYIAYSVPDPAYISPSEWMLNIEERNSRAWTVRTIPFPDDTSLGEKFLCLGPKELAFLTYETTKDGKWQSVVVRYKSGSWQKEHMAITDGVPTLVTGTKGVLWAYGPKGLWHQTPDGWVSYTSLLKDHGLKLESVYIDAQDNAWLFGTKDDDSKHNVLARLGVD
jgi:hypothetical protein